MGIMGIIAWEVNKCFWFSSGFGKNKEKKKVKVKVIIQFWINHSYQ